MFFDFYTYPYLTLGYPLIAVLSYAIKKKSQASLVKLTLRFILTWTLGYLLTWVANVLLASIILGASDLSTTRNVLDYRLNKYESSKTIFASIGSFFTNIYYSLSALIKELLVKPHSSILVVFIALWVALWIPFKNKLIKIKDYLCFVPMILYIILWFAVASYPVVYTHYKGMAFLVFVILYILLINIDFTRIKNTFKKHKFF